MMLTVLKVFRSTASQNYVCTCFVNTWQTVIDFLQQWETENHLQRLLVQARVRSGKRRSSEADWPIADRIHWRRGVLKPHPTDELPAPTAISEMVVSHCKGNCSSQKCGCKSHNLACTGLCLCNNEGQNGNDVHADDDLNGPFLRWQYSVLMMNCQLASELHMKLFVSSTTPNRGGMFEPSIFSGVHCSSILHPMGPDRWQPSWIW